MPLGLEPILAQIEHRLRDALPTALATVARDAERALPLSAPRDYFHGEPYRYKAFRAPAVFLLVDTTVRPTEQSADACAALLYQEHSLLVCVVVEAQTEEVLTRLCWRYAEAVDSCLRDYEMEGADGSRVYSVLVRAVQNGLFVDQTHAAQRVFRRDVTVFCHVLHWDRLRMA